MNIGQFFEILMNLCYNNKVLFYMEKKGYHEKYNN